MSTDGRYVASQALGLRHAPSLGEYLQAVLVVDQQPQPLAHDGVIVSDDDGDLAAVGQLGVDDVTAGGRGHLNVPPGGPGCSGRG